MNVSPAWRPRASFRPGVALGALLALGGLLAPGARAQYPAPPTLTPTHALAALNNDQTSTDGTQPQAGLIALGDGYLYGTASGGGSGANGTVFKVHPDGTGFHRHPGLSSTDGSAPRRPWSRPATATCTARPSTAAPTTTGSCSACSPTAPATQDLHDFAALDGNGFNSEGVNPSRP